MKKSKIFVLFALILPILLSSCSKTLGYSVVLWGNSENGLKDGEIVKVFVRSNITHSYIIENPADQSRMEIKIWQITSPESKQKAEQTSQMLSEYLHSFASVKLDGLPIRAEAANTAKQVYRLREGEVIRVLFKGEGAAVTNAKGAMSGDWFRVLTSDGTQGWCFSYNLDIYKSEEGGKRTEEIAVQSDSKEEELLSKITETRWYPQEFADLIKAKRIDILRMSPSFGFFIDSENKKLSILTADDKLSFNYKKTKAKSGGKLAFEGADVTVQQRESELIVTYRENGKPKNARFSAIGANIDSLIAKEKKRRADEFSRIISLGRKFSSSNYGTLSFSPSGTFGWQNFNLLVPQVISESARGSGTVSIEYFLSDSLKSSYDGVLTFRFSGMEKEANFLYKITGNGLRLEDASKAQIKNNVVASRGTSALVLFFEAGQ